MTPQVVPIEKEVSRRVLMLEGCLEVDGQLHRQGAREVLETLKRVQEELLGEHSEMRDTW